MQQQTKAYCFALAAVFFWSTVATATKLSLVWVSPLLLVCYASTVSLLVLFASVILSQKLSLLFSLSLKDWCSSLFFGMLNPFVYYLLLFEAYDILPAQQCQVINYTWAITMTLLSIPLLKQRVSRRQWLAIFIGYFGVFFIATKGKPWSLHFENSYGIAITLLTTILWALYWILNTKDKRDPIVGLFANFCCAVPLMWVYAIANEGVIPLLHQLSWQGVAGGIYLGFFEMGLSFLLWLAAMNLTKDTANIAVLIFIAPIPSLLFIWLLLKEPIHPSTLVGLALILIALFLQRSTGGRGNSNPP